MTLKYLQLTVEHTLTLRKLFLDVSVKYHCSSQHQSNHRNAMQLSLEHPSCHINIKFFKL